MPLCLWGLALHLPPARDRTDSLSALDRPLARVRTDFLSALDRPLARVRTDSLSALDRPLARDRTSRYHSEYAREGPAARKGYRAFSIQGGREQILANPAAPLI